VSENPFRFGLLGYPLGLARPGFLLFALLAVALGVLGLLVALRRTARVESVLGTRLAKALAPGASTLLSALQAALRASGLLLFAIALAQPQCGSRTELARRRGIDLVVALDASKSMLARDVQPDRLDRAKLELNTLLDSLKGDRVGIVAFAGDAYVQAPLTSDYAAAKLFLKAVDPEQMQQGGTNIGAALLLAQIYLGALVAGLDGGLKYNTWPLIDGAIMPPFDQLLFIRPLWRNLFENILTVQINHRMLADAVWFLAVLHGFDAWRQQHAARGAIILAGAVTLQAALGIITLLYEAALPLALAHQVAAMLVFTFAIVHAERLSHRAIVRVPAAAGQTA